MVNYEGGDWFEGWAVTERACTHGNWKRAEATEIAGLYRARVASIVRAHLTGGRDRAAAIYWRREAGETLASIARAHHVSPGRVRQIHERFPHILRATYVPSYGEPWTEQHEAALTRARAVGR